MAVQLGWLGEGAWMWKSEEAAAPVLCAWEVREGWVFLGKTEAD